MQVLRVGAEPGPGVVPEQPRVLPRSAAASARPGALSAGGRSGRSGIRGRAPGRPSAASAVARARPAQRLLDPAQRPLVALEQLDLELVERAGHALRVEHRDRVVGDLGARRANALAARAEPGDRDELPAPGHCREQCASSAGGRPPTLLLQLQSCRAVGKLELPEALSVLHAVAEREAAPREPVVGRVVVGRDEDARLDRLAAELGELERVAGGQFQLALDRFA